MLFPKQTKEALLHYKVALYQIFYQHTLPRSGVRLLHLQNMQKLKPNNIQ